MAVTVRLTGVESHRIRRFEEEGFLSPARTEGNQRLFSDDDVSTIKEVGELDNEGVNAVGIRAILAIRKREKQNKK